jgi:hypothetical protein
MNASLRKTYPRSQFNSITEPYHQLTKTSAVDGGEPLLGLGLVLPRPSSSDVWCCHELHATTWINDMLATNGLRRL